MGHPIPLLLEDYAFVGVSIVVRVVGGLVYLGLQFVVAVPGLGLAGWSGLWECFRGGGLLD